MIGHRVEKKTGFVVIRGAKDLNAVHGSEGVGIVAFVKDSADLAQRFLVHLAREGNKEIGIGVVTVARVNRLADLLSLDVDSLGEVKCVGHTEQSDRVFIKVKLSLKLCRNRRGQVLTVGDIDFLHGLDHTLAHFQRHCVGGQGIKTSGPKVKTNVGGVFEGQRVTKTGVVPLVLCVLFAVRITTTNPQTETTQPKEFPNVLDEGFARVIKRNVSNEGIGVVHR